MLVQVVDVLGDAVLEAGADANIVDHNEMVDILAEADAAGVRANRDVELFGEQHHGQAFVDAAQPAAVELTEADRFELHELLENYAVLAHLAGGNADRGDGLGNRRMANDIIRRGRLFDPPQIELGQLADILDRLGDVPALVGVDHELALGSDFLAHQGGAAAVVFDVEADL